MGNANFFLLQSLISPQVLNEAFWTEASRDGRAEGPAHRIGNAVFGLWMIAKRWENAHAHASL